MNITRVMEYILICSISLLGVMLLLTYVTGDTTGRLVRQYATQIAIEAAKETYHEHQDQAR